MNKFRLMSVFVILAMVFSFANVNSVAAAPTPDTIVNGSFETGDYTGWTLWEGGAQTWAYAGTWGIAATGQTINVGDYAYDFYDGVMVQQDSPGLPHTFTATDGMYTAFQLQRGSQTHRMYQDISLQSCKTLSLDLSYDNHRGVFDASNQYISLNIRDTSDAIVQTLYKTTQGVDPLVLPATTLSYDVSAFQGSTIRIDLTMVVNLFYFDAFVIDNFRLSNCNQPPTADAGGPYLAAVGETIALDGSLSSDPDGDPLTEAWTADGGTVAGNTYTAGAEAGIYDVCLTVNDGTVDSDPDCTMVVVYDPSGGFVTGGGWIDSPVGAYKADESLSGKATFGFVSKYKKGANVPTGNTEFQFHAASFNFHSSSYEWLVVNQGGANAQFKGEGTVNGALDSNGNAYKFMIWAGDSPDTFRIKIWSELDGVETVVYDNGFDQELGGGSIKVHNK